MAFAENMTVDEKLDALRAAVNFASNTRPYALTDDAAYQLFDLISDIEANDEIKALLP